MLIQYFYADKNTVRVNKFIHPESSDKMRKVELKPLRRGIRSFAVTANNNKDAVLTGGYDWTLGGDQSFGQCVADTWI